MKDRLFIGLDVGSTTVKIAVLDKNSRLVYSDYKRHYSDIRSTVVDCIKDAYDAFGQREITVSVTGSGGMSVASWLKIDFVQEVIASTKAVEEFIGHTDVAIELGGEDAKITYFDGSIEQRMNGTLRRRYRRVHRPDGSSPQDRCNRVEQPGKRFHIHLSD